MLGATGNAGQMAIQIAKLLSAGRVVGVGREISRLESAGADEMVSLVGEPPRLAAEIVAGRIPVDVLRAPLSRVELAWNAPVPAGRRVVFVP